MALSGLTEPALLVVLQSRDSDKASIRRLEEILGLSNAEASVLYALAQGFDPAEIASMRGVSLHTVRHQLKTIRAKTGANRQATLVARALSLLA